MAATVLRERYFDAVKELGQMDVLYQALTMGTNNPSWIEFYAAKYVSQGDPLYVQTQLALGYTSAEMQYLFNLALYPTTLPPQIIRTRKGFEILARDNTPIETRAP